MEEQFEDIDEEENSIYNTIKDSLAGHWKVISSIILGIILISTIIYLIPKQVTLKVNVLEVDSDNPVSGKINLFEDGKLIATKETAEDSYPIQFKNIIAGSDIEIEVIPEAGYSEIRKTFTTTNDDVQTLKIYAYRSYQASIEVNKNQLTIGRGCSDIIKVKTITTDKNLKSVQLYVPQTGYSEEVNPQNYQLRDLEIKIPRDIEEGSQLEYDVKVKYSKISSKIKINVVSAGDLETDVDKITCYDGKPCKPTVNLRNEGEGNLIIYPVQVNGTIQNYISFEDPTIKTKNNLIPGKDKNHDAPTMPLFITVDELSKGKRGTITISNNCGTPKVITVESTSS